MIPGKQNAIRDQSWFVEKWFYDFKFCLARKPQAAIDEELKQLPRVDSYLTAACPTGNPKSIKYLSLLFFATSPPQRNQTDKAEPKKHNS